MNVSMMGGGVEDKFYAEEELKFKIPSAMIIGGSSSSGKTTWILKLIDNYKKMFDPIPKTIVYAYGEYNNTIPLLKRRGITIHKGPPNDDFLDRCAKPMLLIMDDLMLSASKNYLEDIFTKKSHHRNISVIFVTQNLFNPSLVSVRQNAHYIVLMRAPNSTFHIKLLGSKLFAGQSKKFMEIYRDATRKPFGYLLINMHPNSDPDLALRTNIFPGEEHFVFNIDE